MAPSIQSSTRPEVDNMVPEPFDPHSNPLIACDHEPLGWARKDPNPNGYYVSLEEFITYNNFRLAKYREEHPTNSLHHLEAETCNCTRSVAEAAENRKIATRRADVVRAVPGEFNLGNNPNQESFSKRRIAQGPRNRTIFFGQQKNAYDDLQRDHWLQQDAISWENSINKALPQTPPLSIHQRRQYEESSISLVASSIYSDDSFQTSGHGDGYNKRDSSSTDVSSLPLNVTPMSERQKSRLVESIDGYPNPLLSHSDTRQMQQIKDSSSSPSETPDADCPINNKLLEELKDHYLKPKSKTSHEATTSSKPATTQKINNFLYRSKSLPVNVTPMSERQKSRLEKFRKSAPTNDTSQVGRLPHHVAITRPRAPSQLSSVMNAGELDPAEDQLAGIASNTRYQSASYSGGRSSNSHQVAIRRPRVAIVANNNETTHTNGYKSEQNGSRNVRQHIRRADYPEDRSTSSLSEDDTASSDQDPLESQGSADSPSKKIFGAGGSLELLKADTKPALKSLWGSVKAKVRKTKPKVDMSAIIDMFSLRSQDPNLRMVTSNFMISCDQEFQSSLYARLDLLICTVANKFLLYEHFENRITPASAAQYIRKWVRLGRAQFTEFNCGQPYQALIIWESRGLLHFYGNHETRVRDAALDTWRINANSMSVLTRCNGDSVVQKHLFDSWKVLEVLGGTWNDYETLSRLHISFHEAVAVAKTRNEDLGIEHDWNPPPVPLTPTMASIMSPDLSRLYRQG